MIGNGVGFARNCTDFMTIVIIPAELLREMKAIFRIYTRNFLYDWVDIRSIMVNNNMNDTRSNFIANVQTDFGIYPNRLYC